MIKGEDMKYLVLGILLTVLSGCGGTNNEEQQNIEPSERPTSPVPQESAKQPPSIPTL
jgi:hypothetical protein